MAKNGKSESDGKELQRIGASMHEILHRQWQTLAAAEDAFVKAAALTEYGLLLNSIAAWQIADRKLYQPKFKTLEAYLLRSKDRLGISRAYFFERMRIGAAYVEHQGQLHAAGFREDRDASNLRLFNKAQQLHGTEKAIRNLARLSFREYQHWVMGKAGAAEALDSIAMDGDGIRFEGHLIISASAIARIYQDGEEPFVIGVRSDSEKRAVSRYLGKFREDRKAGKGEKGGE